MRHTWRAPTAAVKKKPVDKLGAQLNVVEAVHIANISMPKELE